MMERWEWTCSVLVGSAWTHNISSDVVIRETELSWRRQYHQALPSEDAEVSGQRRELPAQGPRQLSTVFIACCP